MSQFQLRLRMDASCMKSSFQDNLEPSLIALDTLGIE